jgi:hypothetical protein
VQVWVQVCLLNGWGIPRQALACRVESSHLPHFLRSSLYFRGLACQRQWEPLSSSSQVGWVTVPGRLSCSSEQVALKPATILLSRGPWFSQALLLLLCQFCWGCNEGLDG